jgi:hypothetical protein
MVSIPIEINQQQHRATELSSESQIKQITLIQGFISESGFRIIYNLIIK